MKCRVRKRKFNNEKQQKQKNSIIFIAQFPEILKMWSLAVNWLILACVYHLRDTWMLIQAIG